MLLKRSSCQSFAPKYGYIGFGVRGINGYIKFSIGAWRNHPCLPIPRPRDGRPSSPARGYTYVHLFARNGRTTLGRTLYYISRAISVPLYLKRRPFRESGMLELMNFLRQDNDGGSLAIKFASTYTPLLLFARYIHSSTAKLVLVSLEF